MKCPYMETLAPMYAPDQDVFEKPLKMHKEPKEIRYLFDTPICDCDRCPRIWKNFHSDGNNLCTAMGFSVADLSMIHERCPLPKHRI